MLFRGEIVNRMKVHRCGPVIASRIAIEQLIVRFDNARDFYVRPMYGASRGHKRPAAQKARRVPVNESDDGNA